MLAEFVAAIVLTAMTPFAAKGKPRSGLSPYQGQDMLQLMAIVAVYLILALVTMTSDSAARVAAWFGALVLLTVGLGEAARLAGLAKLLGSGTAPGIAPAAPHGKGTTPGPGIIPNLTEGISTWENFSGPLPEVIG